MYCVIVGDIIHSKSLDFNERENDTVAIEVILERINNKYQNNIMASFGIVRGDAFEGVLFSQQDIPMILQDIIRSCWEERHIKVRISAVVDELSNVSSDRNKADGPAFHKAIQEIENMRAKKSEHWFQVSILTNTIAQPLIDGLLGLLSALTKEWTEKQRELVWIMSDVSNQKSLVSKKMNISASVVNKQLKSANFDAYRKAWSGLEKYLVDSEDASINDQTKTASYTTYYSIGQRKNKLRDYNTAVGFFKKSIELAINEFGHNDSRLVPLYNGLAQAYLEILSSDEVSSERARIAIEEAEKAIGASLICQEGKSHMTLEYAQTINIKGNYFLETKKYDDAIICFENAKEIIQTIYGNNHPMLPNCDNNIAIAYKNKGDYEKALQFYERSLVAAKENIDQDPLDYADSLYNIGLCYEGMGHFQKALEYIEQSIIILCSFLPAKNEYIVEEKATIERIKSKM